MMQLTHGRRAERTDDAATAPRRKNVPLLILAWAFVAIPAGWGVTQTAIKAMDLFRAPASMTSPATPAQHVAASPK